MSFRWRKTFRSPPSLEGVRSRAGTVFALVHSVAVSTPPRRKQCLCSRFASLLLLAAAGSTVAGTITESFDTDPLLNGWAVHGDGTLFQWDATNGQLRASWDSSRPNSYFHRSLGHILTRQDDAQVRVRLRLDSVATGTTSGADSTFQLAFGFVQLASATATNMLRGSGIDPTHGARNTIEFDYFPDSIYGFGATVSPTLISSNNQFASSFTYPLELPLDTWLDITLTYTASNSILSTVILTNGVAVGPIDDTALEAGFTDFRTDAFAICSYNDAGQPPPAGSIQAHGVVDAITLTLPDPPISVIQLAWTNQLPRVAFESNKDWTYGLERSTLPQNWQPIATIHSLSNGPMQLIDTNPPPGSALYRIRADRP